MKLQVKHIISAFIIGCSFYTFAKLASSENIEFNTLHFNEFIQDNVAVPPKDTVFKDRRGDKHVSTPQAHSPFRTPPPSNVKTEFTLDKDYNYTVKERVGKRIPYRAPASVSFEDFVEMKRREMIKDHWRTKSKTKKDSSRVNDDPLEWGLMGKNGEPIVTIKPAGSVTISLGGKWQRTENPAFPVNQQRTGGIDFDQQISLSLAGKIGDRIKVDMNWDTKAAFDFDNNFKVAYEGKDYDIIKDLQVGNVSMPVDNTLIKGAQNLFGVSTKLQFGKLDVTAVVAQQRGVSERIVIKGGGLSRPIDKQASAYEYNRHFFLSHYFKKKFDEAYQRNPLAPNTGFRVTRVEVYKTNISNQTDELRTITAFLDLGENGQNEAPDLTSEDKEGYLFKKSVINGGSVLAPSNDANDLYATVTASDNNRKTDKVVDYLQSLGLVSGTDFEKINSARRLNEKRDYTYHADLGYISLNSTLKDDEALAVAYEYTLDGVTYKVGELPEDYQDLNQVEDVVFLKLLKPQSINTNLPTWSLMMKNIYSLNTSNVKPEKFQLRIIYKDDLSGVDNPSLQEGEGIEGVPLLRLLNMDKLDPNGDFKPDGNFDFLANATVNTKRGKIIFPVLQPYGRYLDHVFQEKDPTNALVLSSKYSFQKLYTGTQNDARQQTNRDKFFLQGSYQSSSSTDIALPGINIAEGSVSITVGSRTLQEGSDFTVDYQFGRVKIINAGVLASGEDITIRYEKSDLFSVRSKSLMGTHLAYNFSENFQAGFTWMYLSEKPFLTRVSTGSEPIKNMQFGLDAKYKDKSRMITKLVDALPGYHSKKESAVDLRWEMAALKPGHSKTIGETGTSYLDDFEGAATPYDFTRSPFTWKISSVPVSHNDWGLDSTQTGFHRAKMNWFTVDNSFFQNNNGNPGFELTKECEENNFTGSVIPQDIFVNRQLANGLGPLPQKVLDLVYYPKERGPYNYNGNASEFSTDDFGSGNVGLFNQPENNWASIVRPITFDTDFEKANIEYLEFWVMSPFTPENTSIGNAGTVHPDLVEEMEQTVPYPVYQNGSLEGKLSFHLGNVNEDVLKDGLQSFENGLPDVNSKETPWGEVTTQQYITNAFDNSKDRSLQDIGLDGLNDDAEKIKHEGFTTWASANGFVNELADISTDNFEYFINEENDTRCILERYRDFNGLENNSFVKEGTESFPQPNYTTPDNEDVNRDKTISFTDSYWAYDLEINANTFSTNGVDNNPYIVDRVVANANSSDKNPVEWYQVRIPLVQGKAVGGISGFQTIKFFRMNMSGFKEPVMLRMVELQLVSAQWRRYNKNLDNEGGAQQNEPYDPNFSVGVVNIEQNAISNGASSPYVLPPGVIRDFDQTSAQVREQNEQSMLLKVVDLKDGDARGVFKNMAIDMINYEKIEMYVHAESPNTSTFNNEMTSFIRLGTDNSEHYYEIEVPLMLSDISNGSADEVWREENHFDIKFKDITAVKLARNKAAFDKNSVFTQKVGKHTVRIKGNPDRSTVRSMLIGLRNPKDNGASKTVTVWVNEMRVTGFNEKMGVATTASFNIQAADLLKLSGSMKYTGNNYGNLEDKISERSRAQKLQYGTAMNIEMDKFLPKKWGLKIPVYTSYDKEIVSPQYNPLDPDVKTKDALKNFEDEEKRKEFRDKIIYNKEVKSVNVTNLRKVSTNKKKKKRVYSVDNLMVSAGYTEEKRNGINNENTAIGNNLHSYKQQRYKGSLGYAYTVKQKNYKPFEKSKLVKSKHLKLIKDFNINFLPTDFSVKYDLDRKFTRTQLYNTALTTEGVDPTYEKAFWFNRTYKLSWNFTKSLKFTYDAKVKAIVDEPEGDKRGDNNISKSDYQKTVQDNLFDGGRVKDFKQDLKLTYKLPLSKIPLVNWINSSVSYTGTYKWKAGAEGNNDPSANEYFYGNLASNAQQLGATGKVNFVKLYNKSKYLKSINSPRRKSSAPPNPADTNRRGEQRKHYKLGKRSLRVLMMVRNVSGSYKEKNSIILPGYAERTRFFGLDPDMDNFSEFLPFIFGYQEMENQDGVKQLTRKNGWLTQSIYTNETITQSKKKDLNLKATIEPFKYFKVSLNLKQTKTTRYAEVYRREDESSSLNDFVSFNPIMGGSVSMSYITARTMFGKDNEDNESPVFETFDANRSTIQARLNAKDETKITTYGNKHQDVMIPAFLAAYSGQEVDNVKLSRLPAIPLPNWRIDYSGLAKLKMFKKKFSTITLKHAYISKYSLTNYSSSLQYNDLSSKDKVANITSRPEVNENGDYVPEFTVTEVTIKENFKPLIGINIRTRKKMSFKVDYNKTRNLALSMANAQITELNSSALVIGIGYTTKKNSKWGKKNDKTDRILPNELTLKIDVSVKNTKTTQRSLDGVNTVTAGNWNFQLRPNISYKINKRATLQFYFERTVNQPHISSSFKRNTTAAGARVRFNLK